MKEALWGYWLIVLGIFIIVVLLLVQSFTSTNTQDYYLVKTITEASMEDAIDWSYYRLYGEVKINKEKFYESFLRRFAEETSLATTYTIEFTEVYEAPPKVGVKVSSKSSTFSIAGDSTTFDIVNKIDAILENRLSTVEKQRGENETWSTGPIGGTIQDDENEFTANTYTMVKTDCTSLAEKSLKEKGIDLCNKTTGEVSAVANAAGIFITDNTPEEIARVASTLNSKISCMSDERLREIQNILSPSLKYQDQDFVMNMYDSLKAVLDEGCE